jgi:glucose-6-phosphate isomerase
MRASLLTLWKDLEEHQQGMSKVTLQDLFNKDPNRFNQLSLEVEDLLFDYSKQRVTVETLAKLSTLAEEAGLLENREKLFKGDIVNLSEKRPATHIALRNMSAMSLKDKERLEQMTHFVAEIHSGRRLGATGKPFKDLLCLGIGGSYLGPALAIEALQAYKTHEIKCHFAPNLDGQTLTRLMKVLDPATTLCLVSSKTFTTLETNENAKWIKRWLTAALGEKAEGHLLAATAMPQRAMAFGILEKNIFEFSEYVGGRYSVWSSVGLPIALMIGMSQFKDFLMGAHSMDQHFYTAPLRQNMPVLMGLIGLWNINFEKNNTLAIMPYEDGLRSLPAYLQQLEMESNGKSVSKQGAALQQKTAPVIWGGVGCDGQHAYMQLLHQGTEIVPVDFLVPATGEKELRMHHKLLLANCLSQSKALMEGYQAEWAGNQDPYWRNKVCPGNRPSSTLMYRTLTPKILGSILALYEHKVFVQATLWNINPFDQWGVELGKKLVKEILPNLEKANSELETDSSTAGLIRFYQRYQE